MLEFREKLVIVLLVVYFFSLILQIPLTNISGSGISNPTDYFTVGIIHPQEIFFDGNYDSTNGTVLLNWSNVTTAQHYNIYYSPNIEDIMELDLDNIPPSVKNFSNITFRNFTHRNITIWPVLYYTVSYVDQDFGVEILSNDTPVGKFTYYYTAPNSSVYGTLASNRINIFLDRNYDAETFLQEIPGSLKPTMSKLDKTDAAGEYLTTHVRGLSDGNNFNMEIGKSYQVTVDEYYNHTIVGKVYLPPYTLQYTVPNSSVFGILASQWYGIFDVKKNYTAETFLQEIPANRSPTISQLNKSDAAGEYLTTHVRGFADGNDFNMEAGEGYVVTVDDGYNHTLCSSISNCFT